MNGVGFLWKVSEVLGIDFNSFAPAQPQFFCGSTDLPLLEASFMFPVSLHAYLQRVLSSSIAVLCLTLWLSSHAVVRQDVVAHPTRFTQCPQFFAEGQPPRRQGRPDSGLEIPEQKLRELCYEAFAVLHSGESRTGLLPVSKTLC